MAPPEGWPVIVVCGPILAPGSRQLSRGRPPASSEDRHRRIGRQLMLGSATDNGIRHQLSSNVKWVAQYTAERPWTTRMAAAQRMTKAVAIRLSRRRVADSSLGVRPVMGLRHGGGPTGFGEI